MAGLKGNSCLFSNVYFAIEIKNVKVAKIVYNVQSAGWGGDYEMCWVGLWAFSFKTNAPFTL